MKIESKTMVVLGEKNQGIGVAVKPSGDMWVVGKVLAFLGNRGV